MAETKAKEQEVPTPESTPAIGAKHARYVDPPGNWSDPPELAEGEAKVEGSFAKKPEEEAKKEREKVEKEEREAFRKAHEDNADVQRERTKWDAEHPEVVGEKQANAAKAQATRDAKDARQSGSRASEEKKPEEAKS